MGVGGHGLVGHAAHPVAHVGVGAGQASHVSVSKPFQGEVRHNSQAKAFGANVAAVAEHPNALHGARHAGVVGHGLAHSVVGHGVADVYPDEISPYTYNYAVADDYSNSNFNA